MTAALRIISGLAVVAVAVYAGFQHRSPWIVLLLGASFTILYIAGKLPQWRMLAQTKGTFGVMMSLLVTFPIQATVAGAFYLIGVGVGALAGSRDFAERLEPFDLSLAGAITFFGLATAISISAAEARSTSIIGTNRLSREIRAIMDDAAELGEQTVAMPIQIFALSRRLADHADRDEALAAMEPFFDHENAFVRRVAFTAIRFMGQDGRDRDPELIYGRVLDGLRDASPWVRYDAAWIVGEIKSDDALMAAALRDMIDRAVADGDEMAPPDDSKSQALKRARESLSIIERRG